MTIDMKEGCKVFVAESMDLKNPNWKKRLKMLTEVVNAVRQYGAAQILQPVHAGRKKSKFDNCHALALIYGNQIWGIRYKDSIKVKDPVRTFIEDAKRPVYLITIELKSRGT